MAEAAIDEERVSMEEEAPMEAMEEEFLEEGAEEAAEGAEAPDAMLAANGGADQGNADIDTENFNELITPEDQVVEAQRAWALLISAAGSRENLGEAFYSAFYESAPSLQHLFITPRAVQAMRIYTNVNIMVNSLNLPTDLKTHIESLGFWHMSMDTSVARCIVFRDAILDLFVAELGSKLTSGAVAGLTGLLNYVAGAILYCKINFSARLIILNESWAIANDTSGEDKFGGTMGSMEDNTAKAHEKAGEGEASKDASKGVDSNAMVQNVPTTYKEMFQFNAAVMGYGTSLWMNEVLAQFDNMVLNVSNAGRMQEECSILVLRIAKLTSAKVNLAEYKSCMLASLRSLLPKDWTTAHEAAWVWMWENVEKLMFLTMGKTQLWYKELEAFYATMDEAFCYQLRADVYAKFFVDCPVGEGYFKQSNTYLHLIAAKLMDVTLAIYVDPVAVVDMISGVGLRHVGYAIPVELFPPWVTVWIDRWRNVGATELCTEGFSWALGLVAKMQTRTITEGTTVVMKAININSASAFIRAISYAPRGERAQWMLLITAGTQDVSPFLWSIQSGAVDAAIALLSDLLTIRADRDKYYYGAQDLFRRHTDVVKILLDDAPALLPRLLDGLIWRSRVTVNATRRVNYYIKDLLLNPEGKFHKTLEWVVGSKDPKTVTHPVLVLLADLVWSRVACRSFMYRKTWFLITLLVFLTGQSILKGVEASDITRLVVFAFRLFIYLFSMGIMIFSHIGRIVKGYRTKDTIAVGKFSFPSYLQDWQQTVNLILMLCLVIMLATDPILHCLDDDGGHMFNGVCEASENIKFFPYSFFTMIAMMLYYVLCMELAVFNNRISAYVLVCGRMLVELALFLLALSCVLLTLGSAFSCLEQENDEFTNIGVGFMSLWEMTINVYSAPAYERLHNELILLLGCYCFLIVSVIFLLNLLVSQLTCAFKAIYVDMMGYARLKRIRIICDSMPSVTQKKWTDFVDSLELRKRIEFNEGDVGLPGGIQVLEPASANPTTVDTIRRFGGTTSPTVKWPEEEGGGDDENDKFSRVEDLIKKLGDQAAKAASSGVKKVKGGASSSGMSGGGGGGSGAGGGSADAEAEAAEAEAEGGEEVIEE